MKNIFIVLVFCFVTAKSLPSFITRKSGNESRIVGGEKAKQGEFPFFSSLYYGSKKSPFCGSFIIDNNYVVTAAHCVDWIVSSGYDPSYLSVVVGSIKSDRKSGQAVKVKSIHIHPQYNKYNADCDMAVLIVNDIKFNKNVGKGLLVSEAEIDSIDVTTIGFGRTTEGGSSSHNLLKVNVQIVDQNICSYVYDGMISDAMICAGSKGKDSCQGDSGGPLFSTNDPTHIVGIVSWGNGCAQDKYPGVYARTSIAYEFIQKVMKRSKNHSKIVVFKNK